MNAVSTPRVKRLRLEIVGREIARAALALDTQRHARRETLSTAPTFERLFHGNGIERYDGAVVEAGAMGHRAVDACLIDLLRERGLLGKGERALLRHSSGLWLRGLFLESGVMRPVTANHATEVKGGDPLRPAVFEISHGASHAMAGFCAVMAAMEAHGKRGARAVRDICCWDRWPAGFAGSEVRAAFDGLVAIEREGW